jgi:hypothetical protein
MMKPYSLWIYASLLGVAASLAAATKDASPPSPPLMVGGFADANGKLGFFSGKDGGIDAVDLETGQRVWTNAQARWPLMTRFGWLAVAAVKKEGVRIQFLKPSDGTLLKESGPVPMGRWANFNVDAIADDSGVWLGARNSSLNFSAWAPLPQRQSKGKADRLQVHWESRTFAYGGTQPVTEGTREKGMVYVDRSSGAISKGEEKGMPPFGLSEVKLPEAWKHGKDLIYWNWSRYGMSWSDKPRPFRISAGVEGFFSYQARPSRSLRLERWRPYEKLEPVEIAAGEEYAPVLALDTRYVVVTSYVNGHDTARLFDLALGAKGFLADLPPFEGAFPGSLTVIGPQLYYVTERRLESGQEKTVIERRLVALDWKSGKIKWMYPLAPRFEYPPIPGAH